MFEATLTGFLTGLSLILAIGAQNAFVLRQGLIGAHVLPLCLLCALSDALLIAAGVAGFGTLARSWPAFPQAMTLAGAAFLVVYGLLRLRAAWRGGHQPAEAARADGLGHTLAVGAAFTWLNPHVYLDTLGLMGAISTGYPEIQTKTAFAAGGTLASFVFFFGLGYGARLLAPTLRSPRAWRGLDLMIGLTMLTLAGLLLADGR